MAYQGVRPEDWVIAEVAPPPDPPPEGDALAAKKSGKGGEIAYGEHNWEDVFAKDGSVPVSAPPAAPEVKHGKEGELRASQRASSQVESVGPYRTRALPPWREPFIPDVDERAFAYRVGPFVDPYSIPVTPENITQAIRAAYVQGGLREAIFTVRSGLTAEEIEAIGKGDADLGMGEFGLVFTQKSYSPQAASAKSEKERTEAEKAAAKRDDKWDDEKKEKKDKKDY